MGNFSRIEPIQHINGSSNRVSAIRGYTKEERAEKVKEIDALVEEHAQMAAIRQKIQKDYPNPQMLSFKELLNQEINGKHEKPSPSENEEGFILDIKIK